jgi:hypothetical protein
LRTVLFHSERPRLEAEGLSGTSREANVTSHMPAPWKGPER